LPEPTHDRASELVRAARADGIGIVEADKGHA
jgi:hypothetical protein